MTLILLFNQVAVGAPPEPPAVDTGSYGGGTYPYRVRRDEHESSAIRESTREHFDRLFADTELMQQMETAPWSPLRDELEAERRRRQDANAIALVLLALS